MISDIEKFDAPGKEPIKINGKFYPLWSKFVHGKEQFIGGTLEDLDDPSGITKITDIELSANGDESAKFIVSGEDFECGFDVQYGGVTAGEKGWMTFCGYGGHTWRIKPK